MDKRDICSLKEKKTMDANTVWQWRIMRVKKYSRRPEPFRYCNEIGLDFNVASNTQKKMDLQLLTNGVILELCDFAKTVNKSKRHFITNILENNFDLGLENEQQRIDFTARILHKVKDLTRKRPKDQHDVFTLFDTSSKPEFNSNNGLNMASKERKTKGFLVEMDDTDDSEHEDEFKCSQATSKEYIKTESLSEEVDGSEHEDELKCSGVTQLTEELKGDVLPPSFPYCEEIGLNLEVGSRQSLDPSVLTKGVMLELVHFNRILTASYSPIVLGVLEHNFELDLKSQREKNQIWFKISQVLKRRKRLSTTGSQITTEFKNEPFSFQTNSLKRPRGSALSNMGATEYQFKEVTKRRQSDLKKKQEKRALLTTSEWVTKRHRREQSTNIETNTLSHHTDLCTSGTAEGGHCYTCPLEKSDLYSDKVTDSGNTGNQDHLENPKSSVIPRESESSSVGINETLLTTTDISSSLPAVILNVNQPFTGRPDKRGLCGGEEQTQTPRNTPNECDMEQEEMGTEKSMWKLRANRVKEILSARKEFGPFNKSKKVGLEFNVGFGPKPNINVDSLTNSVLLELAKFAIAINSSQQNFIMEILEYNFDFGLQSQHQRNIFTCEIMERVRQLRSCEDAVKFSNEVFELLGPMPSINMANLSMGSQSISSVSRMEECDAAPMCTPHSHSETKEHISQKSVDCYPFCKQIGLKLHVNNSQPNKKLEINKLTNGAMTEVTNFAEKLCGTFEQICLDILGHNFDSDLARNILPRIPALMEQKNLSTCVKAYKNVMGTRRNSSTMEKLDSQNNPNLDACGAGSSQAAITDQNVGRSPVIEHQNELNLKLWKLRANHIQQILSIPHEEHCPLYSYSRCKKSGIDFNVGSGVKQNLDPKLLTNGVMVEINTFAKALNSATKHFVTEILEYNFNLNLNNELVRSAFVNQTMTKIRAAHAHKKYSGRQMKMPFELPDMRYIQEPTFDKTTYCPKCYQARTNKLRQDESDPGHMHHPRPCTITGTISADANCTAQRPAKDPSSTFSTIEEIIMENYPRCKEIGLNLCVDEDQPKDKLDPHVLTRGIMIEVVSFAKRLCTTPYKILNDVLGHNFECMQSRNVSPSQLFCKAMPPSDGRLAWFSDVYVIHPVSHKPPGYGNKLKRASTMQRHELKETIKKRKLALQTKEERATLPSHNIHYGKSKTNRSKGNSYPICTEIGLDLDVTSKSAEKDKLDLQLLTRAVVMEIHEFAKKKLGHSYPCTVFDILDYNFDLSSQHYRQWEFAKATAFKVSTISKRYRKNGLDGLDEVFKLPFVLKPKASKMFLENRQNKKSANSSPDIASESESSCMDMEQEEMGTENNYTCPLGESDLDSDDVTDSGSTGNQDHFQNPKSCLSSDILRESESSCLSICAPSLTTTDVSSTLPSVSPNVNQPFTSRPDKRGLCGGEEPAQTPRNTPNECDMEQEEMETEKNMWKLRANRVKEILSALKEFGPFNKSKKVGLEFNVGFGPKPNINVDSLTNSVLLELVKFALAINSSQQNFIMEILEYNFDFGLQSQHQRNIFTCEIMERVRQLRSCEDAVKFSNEVFELPGPMPSINMANLSVGSVNHDISSVSRMEECDAAPMCTPHSHSETKEHISQKSVDCYPFCKQIGLKLHVNNSQPHKKLEINKLTNGAMTEVTNFAEKLCGTFEQICLDILGHNFDSDLARNILPRIPALMEQKNLSTCAKAYMNLTGTRRNSPTMEKLDSQNNPNLDACGAGSSQAAITDQNVGRSPVNEHQNELNLKLWKLRANHIQQILSIPHEEHCPLYSYSRCKKSGIDFNVGSGVKQNLDPKLLTNGIMVEINTFASALNSSTKHFVTEILEYNFNLNLNNELVRSAYVEQTMTKIRSVKAHIRSCNRGIEMPFELPDIKCIQQPTIYCPKCYQARTNKLRQDESDPGHMHHPRPCTITGTVSADANCRAQRPAKDPSSTFSTIEETIMESYPRCKKIGLNLCVDNDQPKDKLDPHVLTRGIMTEVVRFAKKLCATPYKILNDVLGHNFKCAQSRYVSPSQLFCKAVPPIDDRLAWFSDVYVFQSFSHRPPGYGNKMKRASTMQRSEVKETIKKRKLALQTKEERATLPSHNIHYGKSKTNRSKGNSYPICTEIGLDLDVTSKLAEKDKLDLQLLTIAVVMEIDKFATQKLGHSYPCTVFDILDYNFDLSSQHYRQWEFAKATAFKVSTISKRYRKNGLDGLDEVFKLPLVLKPKASKMFLENRQNKKSANSSPDIASESESSCMDMEQEEMGTENNYTCPLGESDLDSDDVTDSGSTGNQDHFQNPKSCLSSDILRESESSCLSICAPSLTTTDVSSTLPSVSPNVNQPFTSRPDKRGLCGGEEPAQTPRNTPNECDMEQEEMETEKSMWKLRANRVKEILSALKEFGPFNKSKKVGLEFNVGFGPKPNINVDSLTNSVLLELAKFALAINSSQQNFIMEILEYNFDFGLQSQHQRNIFTCEIMERVRQLRSCEDAVKFSNEVFELPGPMPSINMANPSMGSQSISSVSRMEECDAAPMCTPHSHAETKEHISQKSVDCYPFCKQIGLKLHVNNSQPNKKLEINKLTNGAMTEVTNFAEKLCGTFEQICLDILGHNFDSELARNVLTRIPALMEQRNLSTCVKVYKKLKGTRKNLTMEKLDSQNNPNLDACGAGSSQAAITDQNVGSSPDIEHQNELNLKLWKLRANHIQQILSIPHEEHCPLYSYSRCKKSGIDFNVGSGVKQNLDPKLLTNGIMVEFNTFATALQSATKHFITEILEYNFNLNLNNELDRNAFGEQTLYKIRSGNAHKKCSVPRLKMTFELPDVRCIQEPIYDKTTYCPKCYQDRNHKLRQDESDPSHVHHPRPHAMTGTVSADANCTAQRPAKDPSSTFSTIEETIMENYPRCKEIGLNLCVDKDQPKDKLDRHVLTRAAMNEVAKFAKKLCGTKSKIVKAVLEHNFNIGMQSRNVDPVQLFRRSTAGKDDGLAWFSEVFVIQPCAPRLPGPASKLREANAMQGTEVKETIRKRQLALQTKEERATLPSHNISDVKSKRKHRSKGNLYPICSEIGLDLDVTKSGEKEKLDLQLLTRAVVMEIHKFAAQKLGHYFPLTIYNILDYNFDLSSQHYRRLEFTIATASKVQSLVNQYRKKRTRADEVFKLPFVFAPKASQRCVEKRQNKKPIKYSQEEPEKETKEGSFVRQVRCHSDVNRLHFLNGVKTNEDLWSCYEYPVVQLNRSLVSAGLVSSHLQGNIQIKEEKYDPHYGDVKSEPDTEDVERSVPGEPAVSQRYAVIPMSPNSESNMKTDSENEGVKYYILAEPQGSEGHAMLAVCPNTESNIKTESDTEGVNLFPVEAAASQGYSMITIGQGNESALIKEEEEHIPADSYHYYHRK